VASAETILTFTTAASQDLFHATPTNNMMNSVDDATIGKKAVKADDAEVPVYLWDMRIRGDQPEAKKTIALNGF
jgi:2-methylaconitate cis-trans-isomerase PrpF